MKFIITPCGDNCEFCPKYTARTTEELQRVAELWYKVGWRDRVVPSEEVRCTGCSSHKSCSYGLIECLKERNISKCNQCVEFPCDKIKNMLKTSKQYEKRCREVCSESEFYVLSKAFFEKEMNLGK